MEGRAMGYDREKEQSFEYLYETYHKDIYRVSLYYTKDEYTAQDITQKVFYELYLHYDNIDMDKVRAYLMRAARNTCFNWFRDTNREIKQDSFHTLPEDTILTRSTEDLYVHQEQNNCEKEFFAHIMNCLREENESWYDILNLIYCLGKSREEAAEELGITVQVLYSKLYRAKQWLKRHFEDEYKEL